MNSPQIISLWRERALSAERELEKSRCVAVWGTDSGYYNVQEVTTTEQYIAALRDIVHDKFDEVDEPVLCELARKVVEEDDAAALLELNEILSIDYEMDSNGCRDLPTKRYRL